MARRHRRWHVFTVALSMLASVTGAAAHAAADDRQDTTGKPAAKAAPPAGVPAGQRASVLGEDWRTSTDRAWTTSGDADGFHLLVASAADGYTWRTIATLSEPGVDSDSWIGNACVTASGHRAVVAYAPRTFTNETVLSERGAFTAVVDLTNGAVRKLPVRASLAYFSPSCGAGEQAVLTQEGTEDLRRTRLLRVNAATGAVTEKIQVPGQLTSAVPTAGGIVAADSGALVRVDHDGKRHVLAETHGVPFKLAADASGGVVYLERPSKNRVNVKRLDRFGSSTTQHTSHVTEVATGSLTGVDVTAPRAGRVFVTGEHTAKGTAGAAPKSAHVVLAKVPVGAQISMQGDVAMTSVRKTHADPRAAAPTGAPEQVGITVKSLRTGKSAKLAVTPSRGVFGGQGPNAGRGLSPSLGRNAVPPKKAASPSARHAGVAGPGTAGPRAASATTTIADTAGDPSDSDQRYCSVPRDDPANQTMQPKPRQVEWAVDQAVRNVLTVERPANWKNLQMPAYTPQGLFPPVALAGGGFVPAQIMLGVAAQESNLWEAARFAVPGVTANPLIGNYYGNDIYNGDPGDDWDIHFDQADCGYGVTQVTDGMRLAGHQKDNEVPFAFQTQRAVALDFAANVAAGLQILEKKWNETRNAGLVINNGDSSKIENWFFAVWAYNSGFHANTGGPWGVGWANNPANPHFPANRSAFLDITYEDAAHPQDWPYPEKVMGWAGHPVEVLESPDNLVSGFRPAWWNGDIITGPQNRTNVKPPVNQFCDGSNNCEPGAHHLPNAPEVIGEPAGPCAHQNASGQFDLQCWYHTSSTWKPDCDFSCGNELLRFDPGFVYQDDGTAYPPRCDLSGLPGNAMVVDDVADNVPSIRPNCGHPWTNQGTFALSFKQDSSGQWPGKIDTHQLGAGFGGHLWFTHTRSATDNGGKLEVNGTWTLNQSHNGPMKIMVALPDNGAQTDNAAYTVTTAQGNRTRVLRQPGDGNRWVSLGAFMFNNVPKVTLTSVTPNGDGSDDIAFDAVAFVPITGTYHEESVESDALFDENQNIDTSIPTSWLGGQLANRGALHDWAMDKANAILDMPPCQPEMVGDCLMPSIQQAISAWRNQVEAAGTDTVNHPLGNSISSWIGFSNSYLDRPSSDQRPSSFDNDNKYKIKLKATVSFVVASDGTIVSGSEFATYEHRTANTHLPEFFKSFMQAVSDSYGIFGISKPNLSYRLPDLNHHDGEWTSVNPITNGGLLPGRAYTTVGKAPVPVDAAGNPSTTNATCVAALANAGGSIGYRPMLSAGGPSNGMDGWVNDLEDSSAVADPVADLASSLRDLFFDDGHIPGITTSAFAAAPPIWQELNFKACADGSVRQIADIPVLVSSWMPDEYLYHNGKAINLSGAFSGSAGPVYRGEFDKFSRDDISTWDGTTGYGGCGPGGDRSGNPWSMGVLDSAGTDPSDSHFCLAPTLASDPEFSG